MKFHRVTWRALQTLTFTLSEQISQSKYQPDLIVAIARGGTTIAHILSDFLKLPITTFTISSYQDFKQQTTPQIKLKLGDKLHNRKIILVDDVSDSGKTFKRGIDYLKELGAHTIKTAALFKKPHTEYVPDYCAMETKKWIVFPFDMRETVEELTNVEKKNGMSVAEIKKKLAKVPVPRLYIERYCK